jgi:dTDP-4-amino-4,6-dideoxygalactose transaminase
MKIPFVDLYAQYLTIKEDIDAAISNTIKNASYIGGNEVRQFEQLFASLIGVDHVISCGNGTDALEILLECYEIGKGDEVIVPAVSWISTSECVGRSGATPIFVDIDENGLIDITKIESKITEKTKAIIPVHLYGQAINMQKIIQLSRKYNIIVIEDCAQAHLAEINQQKVGTYGHAAAFSFYPGKNLGAYGDAGCIATNNKDIAEKARLIANHGQKIKHKHLIEGRNSRLDGLQAAVLNVKIPHLPDWTKKRIRAAQWYKKYLSGLPGIKLPIVSDDFSHVYHLFVIQVKHRDELMRHLQNKGIEVAIHYPTPIPLQEAYKKYAYQPEDFPHATRFCNEILSLPMYPEILEEYIQYISDSIHEFYKQ